MSTRRRDRRTWFAVITEPGRHLAMTSAMGLLIISTTVSSSQSSAAVWRIALTAFLGSLWYRYMMRRWRVRRNADPRPSRFR
ncbi:MAG: hypothetical protein EOO67_02570 [Microbacterium sp.]|nr:MAG: hypothetical protein EOO67_02570 [Microbacterium sp.]